MCSLSRAMTGACLGVEVPLWGGELTSGSMCSPVSELWALLLCDEVVVVVVAPAVETVVVPLAAEGEATPPGVDTPDVGVDTPELLPAWSCGPFLPSWWTSLSRACLICFDMFDAGAREPLDQLVRDDRCSLSSVQSMLTSRRSEDVRKRLTQKERTGASGEKWPTEAEAGRPRAA